MKRFQYRLQALLTLRERQEHEALRAFAEMQRRLLVEQSMKKTLENELLNALTRREDLSQVVVQPREYAIETMFIDGNKKRIEFTGRAIQRAQRWVDQSMRIYRAARQRREVIDRLKLRAHERFKMELRKLEQKALDDIYVMRSGFQKSQQEGESA